MPRGRHVKMKRLQRGIATGRVKRLLALGEAAAVAGHLDRAHRYAWLAHRLSLRHQLKLSPEVKARVCRGCQGFLAPGVTSRTRTRDGRVVTTCLRCGRVRRRPLAARAEA